MKGGEAKQIPGKNTLGFSRDINRDRVGLQFVICTRTERLCLWCLFFA